MVITTTALTNTARARVCCTHGSGGVVAALQVRTGQAQTAQLSGKLIRSSLQVVLQPRARPVVYAHPHTSASSSARVMTLTAAPYGRATLHRVRHAQGTVRGKKTYPPWWNPAPQVLRAAGRGREAWGKRYSKCMWWLSAAGVRCHTGYVPCGGWQARPKLCMWMLLSVNVVWPVRYIISYKPWDKY